MFGDRDPASVTRTELARLHRKVGFAKPHLANRLLALLSHFYNWAETLGYVPPNQPNPARHIPRFPERSRERWLTSGEVRRLLEAVEKEPSIYLRAFIWLALLTGCRKNELLGALWEDVDLERGTLRLPKTKSGRVHYVPLSQPARDILDSLPREHGNAYVFPGLEAGAPLVNVYKPWNRIRKRAGLPEVRLHDLRRTVGSWLAQDGASLPLIGSVLNHTSTATTQVYARLAEDGRRGALEKHGQKLLSACSSALPA